MNKEELRHKFEELAQPLIDFINEKYHPHATIIIDSTHAELLEVLIVFPNKKEVE